MEALLTIDATNQCLVVQLHTFPTALLVVNPVVTNQANKTIIKHHFTMEHEYFEKNFESLFLREGDVEFLTEIFYDKDFYLMENNRWLKEVIDENNQRTLSFKIAKPVSNNVVSTICYNEQCTMDKTSDNYHIFDQAIHSSNKTIKIEFWRAKYHLKENSEVKLIYDQAFMDDDGIGSAFLSLYGQISLSALDNFSLDPSFSQEINELIANVHPCRSKVIEYLFMNEKDIYDHLLKEGAIAKVEYTSPYRIEQDDHTEKPMTEEDLKQLLALMKKNKQ